jgi:hypothetical protein
MPARWFGFGAIGLAGGASRQSCRVTFSIAAEPAVCNARSNRSAAREQLTTMQQLEAIGGSWLSGLPGRTKGQGRESGETLHRPLPWDLQRVPAADELGSSNTAGAVAAESRHARCDPGAV